MVIRALVDLSVIVCFTTQRSLVPLLSGEAKERQHPAPGTSSVCVAGTTKPNHRR
jgi:hypothetical protein